MHCFGEGCWIRNDETVAGINTADIFAEIITSWKTEDFAVVVEAYDLQYGSPATCYWRAISDGQGGAGVNFHVLGLSL